jgi:hypothetical protein
VAAPNCFAIIDLVSRKWISTLLSPEETAAQTQVVFLAVQEVEGLLDLVEDRLDTASCPPATTSRSCWRCPTTGHP